jgi:uncharacterized protein (TIGR02145 family)
MKNTSANDTRINSWDNPDYYTSSGDWPANSVPCPAGWRLPDIDELAAVVNMNRNNGNITEINILSNVPASWVAYKTDQSVFSNLKKSGDYLYLPAASLREYSDRSLRNRGYCGVYWSSSSGSNSSLGLYMSLYSESQHTDNHYRGAGFSVRCVQAE